jgi:hypothetical protein
MFRIATIAFAALISVLTASQANAQVISQQSSQSNSNVRQSSNSSVVLGPGGVLQTNRNSQTAIDTVAQSSGFTLGPGGVNFNASASAVSQRNSDFVNSAQLGSTRVTNAGSSSLVSGASTSVNGSITPSGATVIIGNRVFAAGQNTNSRTVETPGGTTIDRVSGGFNQSRERIQVIRR